MPIWRILLEHWMRAADSRTGQDVVGVVEGVGGDAHLAHLVGALDAGRGLADFLDGRQEQADEDSYDGDDHQ
jgi:hypothetical protein